MSSSDGDTFFFFFKFKKPITNSQAMHYQSLMEEIFVGHPHGHAYVDHPLKKLVIIRKRLLREQDISHTTYDREEIF